ncbi:MAG: GNAT family N-acetyltransferase [Armatimonadetes bacterium]|nr:GNAT family N-acetyltransferase [Armatimonadota bacterium]
MAEVILKEITKETWSECMNLALHLEQGGLVAPNSYRFQECKAVPTFVQVGIHCGKDIVGYAMYGVDPDDGKYWIFRLMIDEKYQRRGYAKAALAGIIQRLKALPDCNEIYVGYRPENHIAAVMYGGFNFVRTGQMLCGEFIARLDLKNEEVMEPTMAQIERMAAG